MTSLTAVILAFNEERHIARAIESLRLGSLTEKIFVVDSYSTDNTRRIAEEHGAVVVEHTFVNQAQQFQWALESLPIDSQWIIRIDADEIIYDDLAEEIASSIQKAPRSVGGFTLNRRHIFLGRWIKYGGRYPLRLLRVWRTGLGRIEDRWMDEHVVLSGGSISDLSGRFEDRNLGDLNYFTRKHNQYASREALEVLLNKYELKAPSAGSVILSGQARAKRIIKERVYNRLPYQVTSLTYFLFRFVFQLGFLDGPQGFVYHFLQGYWYRFLVGAKVQEMEAVLSTLPTLELKQEQLTKFSREVSK